MPGMSSMKYCCFEPGLTKNLLMMQMMVMMSKKKALVERRAHVNRKPVSPKPISVTGITK